MQTKTHLVGKIFLIVILLSTFLTIGCAKQMLNLSTIEQGKHGASLNLKHFKESSYTVYMLFDLVTVSPAKVEKILQKVNPDNKPVINLKIISEADALSAFVNILNGGAIDRGVIISLNKVTVEGDIVD